ncbi:extracellular solute-binding protein [Cohnella xylanilytica]|uniref:Extracellular solute-binding protein n=1 Tax=Cohnella xylanilytica TaxID=557555 RepID=A0A841U4T6_9BACL|nr:extracellular solute-binding protein [Cohnella xylanilytica]MBB6694799.1 extracellular solute-binding protein [Cohnella xylanilytica]
MIKPLRALAAAVALVPVLASCSAGGIGLEGGKTIVSDKARVIRYVTSDLEFMQPRLISDRAREYEKSHPDVKYEFENVGTSDLLQKIQLLAASNDLPDLFAYESGRPLERLSDNGYVLDVEKAFAEIGLGDELNPAAVKLLKSMTRSQGLYALPLEINVEGFWYNKKLFAKYGVKEPKTWDELLQAAERFRTAGVQPFALAGAQKWPITRLINGYVIRVYGYDAMQKVDRGELRLTDPGFVEAASVVQKMALRGYFGDHVNTTDMEEAVNRFLQGQAAMYYTGSWSLRDFNDPAKNRIGTEQIGLFNIPLVAGGKGTTDDWLLNAGLTTSFSAASYDDTMKKWVKAVFEDYGDRAMKEKGVISGFKVDRMPASLPSLTQLAQTTIESVKNGALWFEALFDTDAQAVAWDNAQLLVMNADYTPRMYMEELQAAIDRQQKEEE